MRVSDLIHGRTRTIELKHNEDQRFPKTIVSMGEAVLHQQDGDEWLLRIGEEAWPVEGASDLDQDNLRGLRNGALHRICWLAQKTPKMGEAEQLTLQVHEFVGAYDWAEPVQIGIDDRIVEDMRRQRKQLNSVESLIKWLTDLLLIHPQSVGGPVRALLAGSPGGEGKTTAFRLYGKGRALDVVSGADNRLRVTRVVSAKGAQSGDETRPLYLVSGDISFCDLTLAGEFRGSARTEIAARTQQGNSYLRLWQQYNDLERATYLERAQELGWLPYRRCEQLADGAWRFQISGGGLDAKTLRRRIHDLAEGGDNIELEAGAEIPATLQGVTDQDEERTKRTRPFVGSPRVRAQGSQVQIELRAARSREDRDPPDTGWLFVSLGGDETRIRRRRRAWEQIRGCSNPMPQLGLIIEGAPVPARALRDREAMTPTVCRILPSPTDRQRLALDKALNTPDICLIQGPPGTGKTRVIAALQARLAERDEVADGSGLAGNTLLTSFQHDAVENAAAATRVLGLPAIKIGYGKGSDEGNAWLEGWKTDTIERVRAARAERGGSYSIQQALDEVRRLTVLHIEAPGPEDASIDLLRQIRDLAREWLPSTLLGRIDYLFGRLSAPAANPSLADKDLADALRAVRGLRTESIPFSDDGPDAAYRALRYLDRLDGVILSDHERVLLDQSAEQDPDDTPPQDLLDGLTRLRDELIDRLNASGTREPIRPIHADVADLCTDVVDALVEKARTSPAGVDMAVAGWLDALENDPEGIHDTIAHYSMVLAATCQQSVAKPMSDAKSGESMVFRTVVVDEAARANPLDLLIPMALAERRVVLVGDHRQLPHVLEPDVEKGLAEATEAGMQDALKRSLFERLFRELREREQRDGIKRTVTLDTQYRMHPALGAFVSEQFYEPHGEALGSGRNPKDFAHRVALSDGTDLTGKVAAWVPVSRDAGPEDGGRSKRRRAEAERAVREARAILDAHPDLSLGIITFYAAQREAIFESLQALGLCDRDRDNNWRIQDRWERTPDGRERLRVGTVDAFQGKEFDVVLLSVTRCNRIKVTDEQSRRRRYGFLLLENRLCVAMSRQQRLLIALGDLDMAQGEEAEQSVPALAAFAKLCQEEAHGHIVRT